MNTFLILILKVNAPLVGELAPLREARWVRVGIDQGELVLYLNLILLIAPNLLELCNINISEKKAKER